MLGMIAGNGHPYSWSAIVNGFEESALASCPYPVIVDYLSKRPSGSVGIEGAAVTHIWTDSAEDADKVAKFARIPHVVGRPEDVVGEVDAVMIATDDGDGHVRRARPFVEAGLPVFIDKPLADNVEDLRTFRSWQKDGARLLSSSGLRYAAEFSQLADFPWQWITGVTCNTWRRYGIHVLEPVYCLTGPGYLTVRAFEQSPDQFVYLRHHSGRQVTVAVLPRARAVFGSFHAYGEEGERTVRFSDTFSAFQSQMRAFVDFAASGRPPYPFEHTVEMMAILTAAEESRRQGGIEIELSTYRKGVGI